MGIKRRDKPSIIGKDRTRGEKDIDATLVRNWCRKVPNKIYYKKTSNCN